MIVDGMVPWTFILPLLAISCGLVALQPKEEMAMARVAFMAAKKEKGFKYAPVFFRRAEYYYLKAKSSYRKKYFNKAKRYALLSKKFSERAELIAVKKKLIGRP